MESGAQRVDDESGAQRVDDESGAQRVDDDSEPQRADEPSLRSPLEGLVCGVLAVVAAVGVGWVTVLSLLCMGDTIECASSRDGGDLAGVVIGAAVVTAVVGLGWMVVITLVCGALGRRAPSRATWLLLPATLAAFSIGPVVVIADQQPARPPIAVDPYADPFQWCAPVDDQSERWPYR